MASQHVLGLARNKSHYTCMLYRTCVIIYLLVYWVRRILGQLGIFFKQNDFWTIWSWPVEFILHLILSVPIIAWCATRYQFLYRPTYYLYTILQMCNYSFLAYWSFLPLSWSLYHNRECLWTLCSQSFVEISIHWIHHKTVIMKR